MTTVDDASEAPAFAEPAAWQSPLEQIEAELDWLALRLRVVVERGRRRRALGPPESYRGLYVSDEEVEHLLSQEGRRLSSADLAALIAEAESLRARLNARTEATLLSGIELPIERTTRVFGLSQAERAVLIVSLASSVDSGYEKVYAYANDDITKRRPTVELALDVLSDGPDEVTALRPIFYPHSRLDRNRLIAVVEDTAYASSSFLTRKLELDEHVAEVLVGASFGLDPRLESIACLENATGEDLEHHLANSLSRVLARSSAARVYLSGRGELEKQAAAQAGCAASGFRVVIVDTPALRIADNPSRLLPLLLRDARLLNAGLFFSGWDYDADGEAEVSAFNLQMRDLLGEHPLPVFFSGVSPNPRSLPCELHLRIEVEQPGYAERLDEWGRIGLDGDIEHLAATFRLGAKEIRAAVRMAQSLADARGAPLPSPEDLKTAARLQSQPRLTSLAQRIVPHFNWDDIVLPQDRLEQLREISTQVLHQHVVYEDWGFGAKVSLGRGVTALFAGQSGTGKTMAAEIIAGQLGLELYKIDLSGLVSKYIGETEKNLARVFDEAGASNAILFFDEADAVFGKRTEVRDSHDRYANIEVSYLLQKMEEYEGMVVLATNLRSNLDEAFLRRMKAVVEFPFPEEEDRLHIWQRTLSSSAPVAEDVDLAFMARQFRIAGGNIKNIVLLAAFLAAESRGPIRMSHFIRAAKREFQKLGRLIAESDFGPWYGEVRP